MTTQTGPRPTRCNSAGFAALDTDPDETDVDELGGENPAEPWEDS